MYLSRSKDETDYRTLQETVGALFFGVPTDGMDVDALASIIGNLPASYSVSLLDEGQGFRLRQSLHNDFCQVFDQEDSRIYSFFETRKTKTVTKVC